MKKFLVLSTFLMTQFVFGQNAQNDEAPSGCSAIFFNNKMLVDEYSPNGKCRIQKTATGEITAGTVNLGENNVEMTSTFEFALAIKSKNTGTLMLFSKETYKRIDIQQVLAKCSKGDSIVILTTNNSFDLPHNEILVE